MSEISGPFMHIRVMLRYIGLGRTKAYYLSEDAYFSLYFIGRVCIGSVVIWNTLMCDKIILILKIVGFPLEIRSIFYLNLIYGLVV